MICIGDRVTERPFESSKRMSGRVIYVHPSQRWYTVEFEVGFRGKIGKYREAFFAPIPAQPELKKGYRRKWGGEAK